MESLQWWITVIEVPVIGVLFAMLMKTRADLSDSRLSTQAALSNMHLQVAQNYVTNGHLKDVEERLTKQLGRIEDKLDRITAPQE